MNENLNSMFRINEYRKIKSCKDVKSFFWLTKYLKLQDALERIERDINSSNVESMKKFYDSWSYQVVRGDSTDEVVYEKTII